MFEYKIQYIMALCAAAALQKFFLPSKYVAVLFFSILYILVFVNSPGGPDLTVYEDFSSNIFTKTTEELINFLDTEFYLYPFMAMKNIFGGQLIYYIGSSIFILHLYFRLVSENRQDFDYSMLFIFTSVAMPFIFTNVVRQGYATIFLCAIYLNARKLSFMYFSIWALLTHRSSIIFLYLRRMNVKYIIALSIVGVVVGSLAFDYFRHMLPILDAYQKFLSSERESSGARLIVRILLIAVPFYAPFILMKSAKRHMSAIKYIEYIVLPLILFVAFQFNYKIADRFSYYYVFVYAVRINELSGVQKIMAYIISASVTVFAVMYGVYDNLWDHVV